jgi:hypothetical protein
MEGFYERPDDVTGAPVDDEAIRQAERELGHRLPDSYVALIEVMNGGRPKRRFFRTDFATSWSPDGFQVRSLLGLCRKWGIDSPAGSKYLVAEWEYPDVGVVIFDMPSGGHDVVMLDYRDSEHEPAVVYVDEDRVPRRVADSFAEFVDALEEPPIDDGQVQS